jgi:hypothetical protein
MVHLRKILTKIMEHSLCKEGRSTWKQPAVVLDSVNWEGRRVLEAGSEV